jgi:hypothetical protein
MRNKGRFTKGLNHYNWRGSKATYPAFHCWLRSNFGSANKCENPNCLGISKNYDWALIHGKTYDHIKDNFIQLCRSCHVKYDMSEETKKKISKGVSKQRKEWFLTHEHPMLNKHHSEESKQKISKGVKLFYAING